MDTKKTTSVYAVTQLEGVHQWPECPHAEVVYLRSLHRHLFHVKAFLEVLHDDREVEFLCLKHVIDNHLDAVYPKDPVMRLAKIEYRSCEMIADELVDFLIQEYPNRAISVEVSEDQECGAVVTYKGANQ